MQEKGTISIHTENIFPIIKKFLYSDHEIFLRELVSNAVDATQKIKRLASLGQYNGELGDLKVEVSFDEDKKTITISDRGLGMTADEIKKYINQIAFSGAAEFVERLNLRAGEKVLDVACGAGSTALPAARFGANVTGIDIAPNLIEEARENAQETVESAKPAALKSSE